MNHVDALIAGYARFVSLPWQQNLAPAQRVWMAVYPPEHERRIRLHITGFEVATKEAKHSWSLIDISSSFEDWMSTHEYREEYFEHPSYWCRPCPHSSIISPQTLIANSSGERSGGSDRPIGRWYPLRARRCGESIRPNERSK